MGQYRFTVTVECETEEEALQVMAERVYFDEDYGFEYTISLVEAGA